MNSKTIQRIFLRNLIITIIIITGFLLILQQTYDNYVRESISKMYISDVATRAEKEFFIDHRKVGNPLISASMEQWSKEDMESDEPVQFTFENIAYWSGYRQLESERDPLWIGFILPESDLFGEVGKRQDLLTILFIVIFSIGIIIIVWLVKRYRNQLTRGSDSLIGEPDIEDRIINLINLGGNLINEYIGAEFSSSLKFHVLNLNKKKVAILECEPSPKPVFLKNKSEEFFFIRSGPSSIKLSASKIIEYLENRKSRISPYSN